MVNQKFFDSLIIPVDIFYDFLNTAQIILVFFFLWEYKVTKMCLSSFHSWIVIKLMFLKSPTPS